MCMLLQSFLRLENKFCFCLYKDSLSTQSTTETRSLRKIKPVNRTIYIYIIRLYKIRPVLNEKEYLIRVFIILSNQIKIKKEIRYYFNLFLISMITWSFSFS